ncbi:MAG: phosphotransferase [Dehalococcoidia bacterium]
MNRADDSAEAELAEFCASHGLTVVAQIAVPDGGSRFLAHVRDAAGEHRFLKRGSGLRGHGETRILRAWEGTGYTAGGLNVYGEDTFTCRWVDGVTLEDAADDIGPLLRRCGDMLRVLHGVAALDGLMPITERASAEWVERDFSGSLPEPMLEAARRAARDLTDYDPAEAVMLHGDTVPANILVVDRLIALDPIGFDGPAGWDVAQLAVACTGRDRRANLADIVAGYGSTPPKTEAAFRYLAFLFLDKHLAMERARPGSRAGVVAELERLARALV